MLRWTLLGAAAALAISCNCGSTTTVGCTHDSQCASGEHCVAGKCSNGGSGGGSGGGSSNTGGGTSGTGGGGTIFTGCDPNAPDNMTRDTDCDGLSDYDEYNVMYANGAHTDPCNADTDGDGIQDGTEMGRTMSVSSACMGHFIPDAQPSTKTDPTLDDTDGDGLKDGEEDKNKDGKVDPGESNPLMIDSDCDGISDPDEIHGTLGCVTDPLKLDTDADGLPDGLEEGVQGPGIDPGAPPLHCTYAMGVFDTDPATKTSACNPDTDGDGIQDGAEDANQNGKLDTGELDPNSGTDGVGPAHDACAVTNLKPINFNIAASADVQVALVPDFAEVVDVSDASGPRGLIFYDATHKVAGLAIDDTRMPPPSDATAEESFAKIKMLSTGLLSLPITQTFTTWDGFAQSVRSSYDQAAVADLKTQMNNIAAAFGLTGALSGTAGINGPFHMQAEYVRRTATRSVILIAITPSSMFNGQTLFTLDDVAGGSALAQFGDYAGVTCDVFDSTVNAKVDFLWVVDDSGSMASSQAAVANTGSQFGTKLAAAGLDWHVAATTTTADQSGVRATTADVNVMQTWFTMGNTPPWFGTSGSGNETIFDGVTFRVPQLLPRTTSTVLPPVDKFRDGAAIHIIALTDTRDQSGQSAASFTNFLNNIDGMGGKAVMHGIICPEGQDCGDGETVEIPGKIHTAIRNTGGVIGDINVAKNDPTQLGQYIDAILNAAIAGTGHQLARPPISATIKVAMETGSTKGTCTTSDVPRDRSNGFDFDSATRKIVFFGNCIPNAAGHKIAVSYRFWNDGSPDPGGDPCNHTCTAPQACDPTSAMCVCPPMCGNVCTGNTTCNMDTCACDPGIG
jgi:hypothetical protein